jgi:hypothetical protein
MQVRPQQPHPINGSSNKYLCAPDAQTLLKVARDQYPEWMVCDGISIVRGAKGETNQVACHLWKPVRSKNDASNFSFGEDTGEKKVGTTIKYRAKKKFKDADEK